MSDIKSVDVLLNKCKKLTEVTNQKKDELDVLIQRYEYYIKKIKLPLRNQHYINCVWSNDDQYEKCEQMSTNFCSCYYMKNFPKRLCMDIVETFGLEYMLHS